MLEAIGKVVWFPNVQFFPSFKMFVVIEEVLAPLAPCAMVYATVLPGLGGLVLAERAGERFGVEVFLGWFFGLGGRGLSRLG